jgi:hypothetical protein
MAFLDKLLIFGSSVVAHIVDTPEDNPSPVLKIQEKVHTDSFITDAEKQFKLCDGEIPLTRGGIAYDPETVAMLAKHRAENQECIETLLPRKTIEKFVDLSRRSAGEFFLQYSTESGTFISGIGEKGSTVEMNAAKTICLFHVHPRATHESLGATMHSFNDVLADMVFARNNQKEVVTIVAGKVCGGPLEISTIAYSGSNIYVENEPQREWVERILGEIARSTSIPGDVQELLNAKDIRVTINQTEIKRIADRMSLPSTLEEQLFSTFQ